MRSIHKNYNIRNSTCSTLFGRHICTNLKITIDKRFGIRAEPQTSSNGKEQIKIMNDEWTRGTPKPFVRYLLSPSANGYQFPIVCFENIIKMLKSFSFLSANSSFFLLLLLPFSVRWRGFEAQDETKHVEWVSRSKHCDFVNRVAMQHRNTTDWPNIEHVVSLLFFSPVFSSFFYVFHPLLLLLFVVLIANIFTI